MEVEEVRVCRSGLGTSMSFVVVLMIREPARARRVSRRREEEEWSITSQSHSSFFNHQDHQLSPLFPLHPPSSIVFSSNCQLPP